MALVQVANAVVGIPYDNGTGKRWITIGALFETDNNDDSKGLPFVLMLDKYINLAGLGGTKNSVAVSFYHPKEKNDTRPRTAIKQSYNGPAITRDALWSPDDEDDIPF